VKASPRIRTETQNKIDEEISKIVATLHNEWHAKQTCAARDIHWSVAIEQFCIRIQDIDHVFAQQGEIERKAKEQFKILCSTETKKQESLELLNDLDPQEKREHRDKAYDDIVENTPVWWPKGNPMPLDLAVDENKCRKDVIPEDALKTTAQLRQSLKTVLQLRKLNVGKETVSRHHKTDDHFTPTHAHTLEDTKCNAYDKDISRTRDETADWKHQCSEKLSLAHATQFIKPDNMR
jgi:hypothetical protein